MTDEAETETERKTLDDGDDGGGGERLCAACQKSFVPDDDQQTVCIECQEWRRALVIIGLFLLFFCFVVLPLLIQVLNTPKP